MRFGKRPRQNQPEPKMFIQAGRISGMPAFVGCEAAQDLPLAVGLPSLHFITNAFQEFVEHWENQAALFVHKSSRPGRSRDG